MTEPAVLHNVVLLVFDDAASAAGAIAELRRLGDDDAVSVKRAVQVERTPDGTFRVGDDADDPSFLGTALGAALGALVGAATGPVGLVFGAGTGMAVGSLLDDNEARLSEAVVAAAARHVRPGTVAVVADVDERDPQVLDALAARTRGTLVRLSRVDVQEERALAEAAERDGEAEAPT